MSDFNDKNLHSFDSLIFAIFSTILQYPYFSTTQLYTHVTTLKCVKDQKCFQLTCKQNLIVHGNLLYINKSEILFHNYSWNLENIFTYREKMKVEIYYINNFMGTQQLEH